MSNFKTFKPSVYQQIVRFSFIGLLSGCVLIGMSAQNNAQADILARIDMQVSFMDTDFSAEYTIVQSVPGEGTTTKLAAMFRRDRENKYLILILAPEVDRGKGYLKIDNNLWLWDPVARRHTVTSARDRFQGTSLRNADFTKSNLAAEYRILKTSKEQLGSFSTTVYELQAKFDSLPFPFKKIWVSDDNLVRKVEDYSLSKQLLRTVAIPSYQKLGQRWVPAQIIMFDELRTATVNNVLVKEKTTVTITKPSTQKMPDLIFTQAYLEKSR